MTYTNNDFVVVLCCLLQQDWERGSDSQAEPIVPYYLLVKATPPPEFTLSGAALEAAGTPPPQAGARTDTSHPACTPPSPQRCTPAVPPPGAACRTSACADSPRRTHTHTRAGLPQH